MDCNDGLTETWRQKEHLLDTFDETIECEREALIDLWAHKEKPPEQRSDALGVIRAVVPMLSSLSWHQLDLLDTACSMLLGVIRRTREQVGEQNDHAKDTWIDWASYGAGDPQPRDGRWWGDAPWDATAMKRYVNTPRLAGVMVHMEIGAAGPDQILDFAALVAAGWQVHLNPSFAKTYPGYGIFVEMMRLVEVE